MRNCDSVTMDRIFTPGKRRVHRYITRSPINNLHAHYTPTANSYTHLSILGLGILYLGV